MASVKVIILIVVLHCLHMSCACPETTQRFQQSFPKVTIQEKFAPELLAKRKEVRNFLHKSMSFHKLDGHDCQEYEVLATQLSKLVLFCAAYVALSDLLYAGSKYEIISLYVGGNKIEEDLKKTIPGCSKIDQAKLFDQLNSEGLVDVIAMDKILNLQKQAAEKSPRIVFDENRMRLSEANRRLKQLALHSVEKFKEQFVQENVHGIRDLVAQGGGVDHFFFILNNRVYIYQFFWLAYFGEIDTQG